MRNQHNPHPGQLKLKTIWGCRRIKRFALTFLVFSVLTTVKAQTNGHKFFPLTQTDTTVQANNPFPGFKGVFPDSYQKNGQVVYVTYNSLSSLIVPLKPTVIYGNVLLIENKNADYHENLHNGKSKVGESGMNELRMNRLSDTGASMLILKSNPANDFVIVEWKLPETAGAPSLYIRSVKGILIDKIKLNGHQNQKVISTVNRKPGTYLISVISEGIQYDSRKLTIIK